MEHRRKPGELPGFPSGRVKRVGEQSWKHEAPLRCERHRKLEDLVRPLHGDRADIETPIHLEGGVVGPGEGARGGRGREGVEGLRVHLQRSHHHPLISARVRARIALAEKSKRKFG
ncbi:hypothetical protein EYF80_016347 [Liparis tanakae]|uniref:Uncharacterized protein n=1 Tax=Liparis tanakae TaxID=230148 RepID=A0A4Z2I8G2_9TELE|nr:hypothetical protein EYF80_016347 [Liparis tanakae]